MNRILIVRMSALGDIVHALPVLAALRTAFPSAEIDWLADRRYAGILDLVEGLTTRIIGRPGLMQAIQTMRGRAYDVALDLQGLLKSAAMARLSGAQRVIGFETSALREQGAAWFYSETSAVPAGAHVVQKNLSVLVRLGVEPDRVRFPLAVPDSAVARQVVAEAAARGPGPFVLINPGAGWPNKRWPPDRFGAVAAAIRDEHGLPTFVLWGRGEAALADTVTTSSRGAAVRAPETTLGDLLALTSRAALMISGDTGPTHIAAAMGTPIVGLYGPTWPERNGPWDPDDVVVSRAAQCVCHHKRQCQRDRAGEGSVGRMCINDIGVDEVVDAVRFRLLRVRGQSA
jgi:lipopolysaccharide heptosyltransferase I